MNKTLFYKNREYTLVRFADGSTGIIPFEERADYYLYWIANDVYMQARKY